MTTSSTTPPRPPVSPGHPVPVPPAGADVASAAPDQKRTWRTFLIVAVILLAAAGAWVLVARRSGSGGESATAGTLPGSAGERPVSVATTEVAVRDVPIYLEGIGSVMPLQTVMVKPQVDGRLDRATFQEGKAVHKGDLLAQIDPRPFAITRAQTEAALARDAAQLQSSRLTLERYERVRKENLIAQQQLDDQRALVAQQEATIKSDQAQLDQAKLQLDYARIRSPIDGVTGVRLVDPGNIIRASDPTGIVMVTQLDPIAVLFSLPQDELPHIAAQMAKGPLRVDVLSRDGATSLGTGNLTLIDNQINQTTASIRLKAVLANPGRTLWPNQFVKARLLLTVQRQALVLPAAAVQRGPQGTFVYVVTPDQQALTRPIKVDSVEGDVAIVSNGLRAGEEVVTEGQAQLRPGARVAARPAGTAGGRPTGRAGGGGGGSAGTRRGHGADGVTAAGAGAPAPGSP